MKKIISISLLCLLMICFLPMGALKANAAEYKENGWTYTVYNGKATVVGYKSSNFAVTVPSKLGGYPVTTIGLRAFENYLITSITIPDSVTNIEPYAFYNCKDLTTVTIGNGVTEIGKYAFSGCSKLKTVTLSESLKTIWTAAFSDCISLTGVTFPASLTEIRDRVFEGCTALTSAIIPDNVKYIGTSAFAQCTSLKQVTLGTGITTIYERTFYGCTNLQLIKVSNRLYSVKADAFKNCTAFKYLDHVGEEVNMQNLKNNVEATGNEYLKNATWSHSCSREKVDQKPATCTTTGKQAYYKCEFCGKCYERIFNKWSTISDINTWGNIPATGHTTGAWQSNSYNHWKVCSTCNKNVESKSHTGGAWQSDGTNHWKVCTVCQAKIETASHKGGKSTCQTKAKCDICNTSYGKLASHNWSKTWDHSDAKGHYHKCQTPGCGQLSPVEAHAPGAAATETREQICTVCSYIIAPKLNHKHTTKKHAAVTATCEKNGNLEYYSCTGCSKLFKDAAATKEIKDPSSVLIIASGHKYTENWSMNETEHWRACTSCGAKDANAKHIPGAEVTETTDQTCVVCAYVIKKAVGHTHVYSEYWYADDFAHWKACTCGEMIDKADHADDDGNQACDSCFWSMEVETEFTETTDETETTEDANKKPSKEPIEKPDKEPIEEPEMVDDQSGISPMIIVVAILGVILLAGGIALVVILSKRKNKTTEAAPTEETDPSKE